MYLRFLGVLILSIITTFGVDAATLRKSSRLSQKQTGELDVVPVPTTQYVQKFFRGHCKNPDLDLQNVGSDKIPSEKYLFTAIDKINGVKASDGYAADATSDNIITMDFLYTSVDKLKPSPDCCLLPWETDDVLSASADVAFSLDVVVGADFIGAPAEWTSVAYGDIGGVPMFVAVSARYDVYDYMGGNVAAWSMDGENWVETTLPDNAFWRTVTFGEINNKPMFVALADDSGNSTYNVAYSTDGKTWNAGSGLKKRINWQSVTFGGGKFVAVADDASFVAYSVDGINWQTNESNTMFTAQNWRSVTYGTGSDGKNRFVAVAQSYNKAAYSTDGLDWKESSMPSKVSYDLISVSHGIASDSNKGRFVAVTAGGSNISLYSSDGVNWVKPTGTLPVTANWRTVTYGDGKWVAMADDSDVVAYSTDGKKWTTQKTVAPKQWRSITFGDDKFVAVAFDSNVAAYSDAGANWELAALGTKNAGSSVTSLAYGGGKFVALASGYTSVHYDATNVAAYSTDGVNWVPVVLPAVAYWSAITYGNGKFVAVAGGDIAESSVAAYSSNGIDWELSPTGLPDNYYWQSVTFGNNMFIAVAYNSDVVGYSYDGIEWDFTLMEPADAWKSVTYGNGRFVAINENNASIAYSDNGLDWTVVANKLPQAGYWQSVAYGNGRFVAIALDSDIIAYSSNGVDWTSNPAYKLPSSEFWKSITYGDGVFVATAGNSYWETTSDKMAYSYDGLNWNEIDIPAGFWQSVAIGDGQIVAIDAATHNVAVATAAVASDTNPWSVTRTSIVDGKEVQTVIISGAGICTNSKCSCKRSDLLVNDEFIKYPGLTLASGRAFSDMNSCNLACAGICADNVINNTDGKQTELMCGKKI